MRALELLRGLVVWPYEVLVASLSWWTIGFLRVVIGMIEIVGVIGVLVMVGMFGVREMVAMMAVMMFVFELGRLVVIVQVIVVGVVLA